LNPTSGSFERLASAQGSVAVPDDAVLHIVALQAECLEPLVPVARQVEGLQVNKTTITGAELAPVAHFANLTYFNASKAKRFDDIGVRHLAGLIRLEYVDLYNTAVTDACLDSLAKLENLEHLHLGGTQVKGTAFEALNGLRRLTWLSVEYLPIGDDALARIQCPALTTFAAYGTLVTPDGVRAFQRRYPRCAVAAKIDAIENRMQRDSEARERLALLIQRVVVGHQVKAEDGNEAVAAAADRVLPIGTRIAGLVPGEKTFAAIVNRSWGGEEFWGSQAALLLATLPCDCQIRVTLPNGQCLVVPWLTARGNDRRRKPAPRRALAN
jgi:hypothetical protein